MLAGSVVFVIETLSGPPVSWNSHADVGVLPLSVFVTVTVARLTLRNVQSIVSPGSGLTVAVRVPTSVVFSVSPLQTIEVRSQ